jgi:hypothetical protein
LAAVLLIGTVVSLAWAPETKHLPLNEASIAGHLPCRLSSGLFDFFLNPWHPIRRFK